MKSPVLTWWRELAEAQVQMDTDLCYYCGHARWMHKDSCHAHGCSCPGAMSYVVAGFVGDR